MQGLIDETDSDFDDRIKKLRKMLSDNQNSYKKAVIVKQETVDILSQNLINEQGKYHPHNCVDTLLLTVTFQKEFFALFLRSTCLKCSLSDTLRAVSKKKALSTKHLIPHP